MPARFLLIDGYNLLHAAGLARSEYGPGDLQRSRERLLRRLVNSLSASEIARAVVVFDARDPPPDRPAQQMFQGMRVLFANPGGDADVLIQHWLAEHSAPRHVTLVSSDHALQRAARSVRARFVDSDEFLADLERRRLRGDRSTGDPDAKPADQLSPAEAEQWLRAFGDLSDVAREEVPESPPTDSVAEAGPDFETPPKASSSGEPSGRRASRRPPRKSNGPPAGKKGAGELSFWMEVFRGIPEAAELSGKGDSLRSEFETWQTDDTPRKPGRKRKD